MVGCQINSIPAECLPVSCRKKDKVVEREKKVKCAQALTDTVSYPIEKARNFWTTYPRVGMVYHHEMEGGGKR
jgi:hypothetical protein